MDAHDESPAEDPITHGGDRWWARPELPVPTLATFAVFATVLWVSAAITSYRFNVALAVLGSVPLLVVLTLGATLARSAPQEGHLTRRRRTPDDLGDGYGPGADVSIRFDALLIRSARNR